MQLGRLGDAQNVLAPVPPRTIRQDAVLYAKAALAAAHENLQEAHELLTAAAALRPERAIRAGWDPVLARVRLPGDAPPADNPGPS